MEFNYERIASPKKIKLHHYGAVNVNGERAYKIGSYPRNEISKAVKAGYRHVGGGNSYQYFTRGEPCRVESIADAMMTAKYFTAKNVSKGIHWKLFSDKGLVFSSVRVTPDIEHAKNMFRKQGLKELIWNVQ